MNLHNFQGGTMRRRRVIRAARVARAGYWGWIWLVLGIVIIAFFVLRCAR